ncbi:hypothetical protein PCAU_1972 [Pseudomonas chlororaphis subsp. aurantiaca]|uniref:hypothetical protein n=1 Tax=Pseudomonas chlororaphis TaxID=587753 RepID=UPI0008660F66|nr:hypothetical protein [Pseudomonas chlororaphis]BAV74181.1 hypothetical protein PCAU_1972 [Pseudomonas chlororaphis subsp. aurantiaca]
MEDSFWTLTVNSGAAVAAAISAVTSAISARAAYRAIRQNEALHAEEQAAIDLQRENGRLLDHATVTLGRAFTALMDGNPSLSLPPKNRINWLTAARLIEEFRSTKERITDPLLAGECASHEAHWRLQIALKLRGLETGEFEYFRPGGANAIQHTSAIIVCGFSTWPDDQDDPIKKYESPAKAYEAIGVSYAFANLRFHLGLRP